MAQFTYDDRRKRLAGWIADIESEVADLLLDEHIFWSVQDIIRSNPSLASARSHFFQWMGTSFVASASVAVRRQVDANPKAISLRRVLEELLAYPDLITRAAYLGVASDGSAESTDLNNNAFDEWADATGNLLDAGRVAADLNNLTDACEKVQHYADRRVAHYDGRGVRPAMMPTFDDLESAIRAIEELLKKYYLILTGTWLGQVKPTITYDWTDVFRTRWIP